MQCSSLNLNRDSPQELLYVSSDKDAAAFKAYFNEKHDWLALPYDAAQRLRKPLEDRFGVNGIPAAILLTYDPKQKEFMVVTTDAR